MEPRTTAVFIPPRRLGLFVHSVLSLLLAGLAAVSLWIISRAPLGWELYLALGGAGVGLALLPVMIYRWRALQIASYWLERDGIRLRWGLRVIDIPMDRVNWVGTRAAFRNRIYYPLLSTPGGILGTGWRAVQGVGPLEFLASEASKLVIILTLDGNYAISPDDPAGFVQTYARLIELGTLTPIEARSETSTASLGEISRLAWVRQLFAASAGLGLLLFAWTAFELTRRQTVILGGDDEPVPAGGLFFLPVMYTLFWLISWGLGWYLARRESNRSLAYILWAVTPLTGLLLLIGLAASLGGG